MGKNIAVTKEFSIPIRVYIEDTDAGGIVYYVNYLKFMERARTELLRSLGLEQSHLIAEGYLFVVHSMDVRYVKPARIDDALISKLVVSKVGKARIVFEQTIVHEPTEDVLCHGTVTVACVDSLTHKPKGLKPVLMEAFSSKTR